MNYIHLRHYHTNTKRFKHPLLDGCKTASEEDLNALANEVLIGADPDSLIDALRGCVSMLVGRYLGNFSNLESFVDDMVSEGMLAVVNLCKAIPVDLFLEKGILKIATSRAQFEIERALNNMRCVASPSDRQQRRLISRDKEPIYLTADTNEYDEASHPEDYSDEGLRDILDAFSMIQPEDELDIFLMDTSNWGRGYQELADECRVGVATIHRRKQRLYQKYLELTR